MNEVTIRIDQVPYTVDEAKRISYDDILKVTKKPVGSTVFYIDTKSKSPQTTNEKRVGMLKKGSSIAIVDGLNISCCTQLEILASDVDGEAA